MRIGVPEKMRRVLQKLHMHGIGGVNSHHYHRARWESSEAGACEYLIAKAPLLGGDMVPSNMPAGFLAVYVGDERRRFVIKAKTLKHAAFRVLLEKSAEEYGYKHDGGLIIPCDVANFEHLLRLIETEKPNLCQVELRHYWGYAPDNSTCRMVE